MRIIQTNDMLKPRGHYAQAMEHKGTLYISGILPFNAVTGEMTERELEMQCKAVFDNLDRILSTAGTDKNKVLKTTVYIHGIELWPSVNQFYEEYFGEHRPARSIVPVCKLHYDSLLELEAIAYI